MLVLGVDPGISGGLSCIYPSGRVESVVMPTRSKEEGKVWGSRIDFVQVFRTIKDWCKGEKATAFIEHAQSMPEQGVVSTFNYGVGFGGILAVFQVLDIPHQLIRPMRWKKAVLGEGNTEGKATTIEYVTRKFPGANLFRTARCTTKHDGMADAICLADYGKTHAE
jgi:crossover junction endodeoxyribonuclease RuvC